MKLHLIDTHLLMSRLRSFPSVKVTFCKKRPFLGALMFHLFAYGAKRVENFNHSSVLAPNFAPELLQSCKDDQDKKSRIISP